MLFLRGERIAAGSLSVYRLHLVPVTTKPTVYIFLVLRGCFRLSLTVLPRRGGIAFIFRLKYNGLVYHIAVSPFSTGCSLWNFYFLSRYRRKASFEINFRFPNVTVWVFGSFRSDIIFLCPTGNTLSKSLLFSNTGRVSHSMILSVTLSITTFP